MSAELRQPALWNGPSGSAWVELQRVLDASMEPLIPLLLERGLRANSLRVLDVGCGAGATTLAAARRIGAKARCLGVDVSVSLIEAARRRAADAAPGSAEFVLGDAQTHAFERGAFDALISRFGVMFFDDPVAAFANLRGAMRSGGTLAFAAWRSPLENSFMTLAARVAAPFLPSLTPPKADAPGQWGFADKARVERILTASGWKDIAVEAVDVPYNVPLADLDNYLARMGSVGVALEQADSATRSRVVVAVRAAFEPFVENGAARFSAACWLVSALAP